MVRMSKGVRAGTRKIIARKPRERGLSRITNSLQSFEVGNRVNIVIDPSIHKGMPHKRFHGLTGMVSSMQGDAYIIEVKVGNKFKHPIISSEHLRKAN
ncbi:MAG: 50S ribosomal protein L21e [Thermoplasmata archaeon]|nr:50S ribosomal protein L21e [Thermoplasmata archaeon]